jgi:CheY-like chemotaxis protein
MASKRLLVADDSLTIQKVIRLALSNDGYEIHAVSTGDDAAEQLVLFRPDVILVDVSLPEKTAVQLKQEYDHQSHNGPVKFVLMSNSFEQIDEGEIAAAGFHGRLVKPFDPAHLRQVLKDVLSDSVAPTQHAPPPERTFASEPIEMKDPDADIRHMTDSTLKMSGLENYEWSVQETAAQADPSPMFLGEKTLASFQRTEPKIQSVPAPVDIGDTTFPLEDHVTHSSMDAYEPAPLEMTSPNIPPAFSPPPFRTQVDVSPSGVMPVSTDQMDKIIREQLQSTLEKMASKLLPDLAEKIIRQEIHRMLSDPPAGTS